MHAPLPVVGAMPHDEISIYAKPPRLLSPIALPETYIRPVGYQRTSFSPSPGLGLRPPAHCRPPTRRRVKATSHPLRRRRTLASHPFDQLPWISALEMPAIDAWDMADLSVIPFPFAEPEYAAETTTTTTTTAAAAGVSVGPDRRRRTSLRTSPVVPTTPRRGEFCPSRVLFRELMPDLDC